MEKIDVVAHNVRFYNLEARAIHCMALERNKNKLALTRSDNSIEIWDIHFTPSLQKVIINDSSNSVEDIKWFEDRLFTCGLEGYIVEYNCMNESILQSTPITGGSAWCIDVNHKRKLMACGTEDGYINILDLGYEKLEHFKFLDKQQGRILCLCWDKSGQHLVTGSMDVIRVWNVDTGHAIHKMKTGRSETNKETIVWCVTVTTDFTIISGDSRGFLCFWDGKIGTQIESNNSHAADILSLVLSEDETSIYCAGVDPIIAMYGRVSEYSGSRRKWAKGGHRRIHEHDVRALILTKDNKLFSGGIDGYLALCSYPPKVLVKFPPLLKGPSITLVPSNRYLLLRYLTHLELWKLGQPEPGQDTCESLLHFSEEEVQLLRLKVKKNYVIVAADISEDGKFIAYSTEKAVAFFKFSTDTISLTKLPEPSDCGPCRLIHFFKINKKQYCACVTKRNDINILEVEENGPDVIHTIRFDDDQNTISHLVVSSDGNYLTAGDCESNIGVWSNRVPSTNWDLHCKLPKYYASITALTIRKGTSLIVVAYSDHKILEYDLNSLQFTQFSKSLQCNFSAQLHTPISSITFDYRRNNNIIVHDDSSICVLFEDEAPRDEPVDEAKMKKLEDELEAEDEVIRQEAAFNVVKTPKHIAKVDWLEEDEMVIVSVCPLKLTENLPPTLARKLFGT